MKLNAKILSIPPYISTAWKNVVSLHIEQRPQGAMLVIGLVNSSTIEIPNLTNETIESVFRAHEAYMDSEMQQESSSAKEFPPVIPGQGGLQDPISLINLPFRIGFDGNMGSLLQHNPEAANSPDLPPEVLEKVSQFSKAMGIDTDENLPKPEPHCNCMHCQVMRVLQNEEESAFALLEEEEVSDQDLIFRDWEIKETGENLYLVTNPLHPEEQYTVFLGSPVGCTCGSSDCEHIKAVLHS